MQVERVGQRDTVGNRPWQRGRVVGRSGLRVRVDFSESGGPPSTWVPAAELRPVDVSPSLITAAPDLLEMQLQPEPEPERESMAPPASPVPAAVPTPRSRRHTMERLQVVDERIRCEHAARSRAHSEAEAVEQETGALDLELQQVCVELARLGDTGASDGSTTSTVPATQLGCGAGSMAKSALTPTSRSPAAQRWRATGHAIRTPNWLSAQLRDELQLNIGYTSKQGDARAHPNEDRVLVECNVAKRGVMLLAVIDGHGGSGVADLLQARLTSAISATPAFQSSPPDLPNAIRQAFRWCNAQCRTAWKEKARASGACVVMALIMAEGLVGRRRCVVGWVGDSRAVLCDKQGNVTGLTHDHDPDEPAERERILAAGGIVTQEGRVQLPVAGQVAKARSALSLAGSPVDSPTAVQQVGVSHVGAAVRGRACSESDSDSENSDVDGCVIRQVAVARDIGDTLREARFAAGAVPVGSTDAMIDVAGVATFGDTGCPVSPEIISCEPDITEVTLEVGRDALLILGSDGLFAPLQNDAVGGLAYSLWQSRSDSVGASGAGGQGMIKPKVVATKLVQKAKRVRGNNDDTTALVLRLTRSTAGDPAGALELDEASREFTEDEDVLSDTIITRHKAGRAVTISFATPRAIGTPRQTTRARSRTGPTT